MKRKNKIFVPTIFSIVFAAFAATVAATPAVAEEYAALEGVKGVKAVVDFTHGSPQSANAIFWAVRNVYDDESTRALSEPPQMVVVFHGPAVKLISTDREDFSDSEKKAAETFADTIRSMKKDGVKFEVCLYAAKVMGVDPATILPEVDPVGNGFISVVGYQAKGYALVAIP